MQRLVAIRPFKYGTRHLVAGDAVDVNDKHALLLRAGQRPKARLDNSKSASAQPAGEREADEIAALRARAGRIGIKVDMRWGVKRLQEEIAKS